MGEHLLMSQGERQRLAVLERVTSGEWTLAQGVRQLGISYRQGQRILKRYRATGAEGLVHQARGRASSHRKALSFKEDVLCAYKSQYLDFGPTLASEMLFERDGLAVNRETLRRWLTEAGIRNPRKSKDKHRSWRKPKSGFGELVQMDGSIHDWFEGRGPRCFLMSMVDDATGTTLLRFAQEETTLAAMQILESWVGTYGIPASLYVDRKNVYVTGREPTTEELLSGQEPATQFGLACRKLGIRIERAHSPQAKGRVERKHGVCQDRLVKEMRLEGICGAKEANAFLLEWTKKLNTRFARPERADSDLHQKMPQELDLRAVFCQQESRSIGRDWTVRFENRWFQILRQKDLPPCGSRLIVQRWQDESVHLLFTNRELLFKELADRPARPEQPKKEKAPQRKQKPAEDHYWRGSRQRSLELKQMRLEAQQLPERFYGEQPLPTQAVRIA